MSYYGRGRYRTRRKAGGDRFGMFDSKEVAESSLTHLRRVHLSSAAAYLDYTAHCGEAAGEDSWSAGAGRMNLRSGDLARGKRYEAMAEQFSESIYVERHVWTQSVAGAFPNVAAYMTGRPDCMWTRVVDVDDMEPLRVWVGLTSSAGVTPQEIERRGAAICAFAIALSERRTVTVTPYAVLGGDPGIGAIVSYDLQNPLSLAQAAAALSNPSVTRGLGIAACNKAQPRCYGAWWRDYDNVERMRAQLGCAENDVYLGSIHMSDPLLSDPVQWIKENLSHLLSDESN